MTRRLHFPADDTRVDDLEAALSDLAGLVSESLGGDVKIQVLNKDHREMIISNGKNVIKKPPDRCGCMVRRF